MASAAVASARACGLRRRARRGSCACVGCGLFAEHGFADAPVGPSVPRTHAAFARALGGRGRAGDAPLPRALALALPAAFVETLSAHAVREGAALDARLAAAPWLLGALARRRAARELAAALHLDRARRGADVLQATATARPRSRRSQRVVGAAA